MRKECYRQAMHFFLGNALLFLVMLFGTQFTLAIAIIAMIIGFAFSKILIKKARHPLKEIVLLVEREEENCFHGKAAFTLFAGAAITLFVFPSQQIAIPAIVALAYFDSISTIAGKKFGRTKTIGNRTAAGSVAGMAATFFMLVLFLRPGTALLAAVTAMLAEYLPIDDNISIPLVTATALSFIL